MDKNKNKEVRALHVNAEVRAVENEDSDRIFEFVISDESVDRHRTVIRSDAWDLEGYQKNGIVAYQHMTSSGMLSDPDPDYIIGKGTAKIKNGKLLGVAELEPEGENEIADKVAKKLRFGSLKATSVGFIPRSGHWGDPALDEDEDTYYFTDVELLEFSIVNVPSNKNAIRRQMDDYLAKEFSKIEVKKKNKGTKLTRAKYKARILELNN